MATNRFKFMLRRKRGDTTVSPSEERLLEKIVSDVTEMQSENQQQREKVTNAISAGTRIAKRRIPL